MEIHLHQILVMAGWGELRRGDNMVRVEIKVSVTDNSHLEER